MKFEIYKAGTEYRWRLRASNNEIVASGEGYTTKVSCQQAIQILESTTSDTPVVDLTA